MRKLEEPVLVIGKILDVEEIKGSKKLYKIKVDVGFSIREIIAGIKKYYNKKELIGKKVVIVANIKPVKFFGIESRGMILAADDGKNIALLVPSDDVKEGSIVEVKKFI